MNYIDITFVFNKKTKIDLKIPTKITVKELIKKIINYLKIEEKIQRYSLEIKDKGILDESDTIKNYKISNGDILILIK